MTRIDAQPLRRIRTEEEKERRRMYGDKGAKFNSKLPVSGNDGISTCITTFYDKDNLVVEYEEC